MQPRVHTDFKLCLNCVTGENTILAAYVSDKEILRCWLGSVILSVQNYPNQRFLSFTKLRRTQMRITKSQSACM